MRNPPGGDMRVLNSLDALAGLEAQCESHIQHEPQFAGCGGALAQLFSQAEHLRRERKWLGIYLDHVKTSKRWSSTKGCPPPPISYCRCVGCASARSTLPSAASQIRKTQSFFALDHINIRTRRTDCHERDRFQLRRRVAVRPGADEALRFSDVARALFVRLAMAGRISV
jgi:hypothetical protein